MNAVLEDREYKTSQVPDEAYGKKYIRLDYEDIKNISDELIEQNMKAYRVLANA